MGYGFGFTFKLHLPNGEDIGTFQTATPNWKIGDEFLGAGNVRFRIVDYVDPCLLPDDGEIMGVWTVTPVELAEPT